MPFFWFRSSSQERTTIIPFGLKFRTLFLNLSTKLLICGVFIEFAPENLSYEALKVEKDKSSNA